MLMMFSLLERLSCQHIFPMLGCTFKEVLCLRLSSLVNFSWKRCACEALEFGDAGIRSDRLGSYLKIFAIVFSSYQFKFRNQPFWLTWSNPLAEPYRGQRLAVFAWSWQGTPPGLVLTQQKTWHDFPLGRRHGYYKHSNCFSETNKIIFSWSIKGTNPRTV